MSPHRIAVAGASGFVGRRLVLALLEAGHEVVPLSRRPDRYHGPVPAVNANVMALESTAAAMRGCTAAYYLVHSLTRPDFAKKDREAAIAFGRAAERAGVGRIVYLGGLGDDGDDLSPHLRSRREVEKLLGRGGVPVTTLRAGIVIGHGGASWEMIRTMAERLPALVAPTWALTRTQPIAVADTVAYLVGVLADGVDDDHTAHTYEIGGADVLRYVDVLSRVNALEGRPGIIVPVPVPGAGLATRLAARVLPLVTGVDRQTVRTLLGSMRNEVVVRDDAVKQVVPLVPMGYDEAVRAALDERRNGTAA